MRSPAYGIPPTSPFGMNYKTGMGAEPLMPKPGGYGPSKQMPTMRAASPETRPAGYGPIESMFAWGGQGFNRAFFLSRPANGFVGPSKIGAVWQQDARQGVWIYG